MDERWCALVLAAAFIVACGDDDGGLDAGPRPDAAPLDARVGVDAGRAVDAGVDAGAVPDAGRDELAITFEVTAPCGTPPGDTLYVTGDFQGWDPGDPAYALTRVGARVHSLTARFERGSTIELKVTRGSFDSVEKGPLGEEIENRVFDVDEAGTLAIEVAAWADLPLGPPAADLRSETVPGFLDGREVLLYVPPGYDDDPSARYPVLYMLDGQNLFDEATSFSGEWEVDESLQRLICAGEVEPLIVVGVQNGGAARLFEYTPWPSGGDGGGAGEHLDAIASVLKPWVDGAYRTRAGRDDTGLSGSSLGGLFSVYGAYARPDTFSRIGALSPSVWWDDRHLLTYVADTARPDARIWVDMGTGKPASAVEDFALLRAALIADGFVEGDDLMAVEDPGARHTESAWRRRFPDVMRFLYPAR